MGIIKHPKLEQLEQECSENLKAALSGEEAFTFAEFNEKGVENRGFSNYSYWGSTFYAFSKNKLAVFLVFTVLAILLFTFLQPYLPGQFDAFNVNNDPVTGVPLRNSQPDSVHWLGTNSIGQDLWSRRWSASPLAFCGAMSANWISSLPSFTTYWITFLPPSC